MKSTYNRKHSLERLEYYYQVINTTVLSKQNAASGLIPASVAITTHGDYTDAWVRDNVYSIYCVYGLALAYRRIDDTTGRAFELEHAVVKLMRGILFSMMRQAPKVEKFKKTQNILDALHAKYNTKTGATVVGDKEWGHLQIDATSLFLVALADMTTSGFSIVYTQDEVDFIQNLVFYIERAYRTPDFGIWERGDKSNHGEPELNSSSIGMAYAALKAINGVNLFGARGSASSTIYVLPDEMTRNKITLQSVLPRESNSKEVDGSILSVIGFPAFAVEDPELIERTREDAKKKLEGRYGWKRFLRDGHQTVVEDHTRLHYNDNELKVFEDIESEWPLFFTYMVLEGLFTDNMDQAEDYRKKLDFVTIDSSLWDPENPRPPEDYKKEGNKRPNTLCRTASLDLSTAPADLHIPLVPELYYVPAESIEAEKQKPHSQKRIPNDNTPLVWALSLYLLGNMIYENLLSPSEMDPLGRRYSVKGAKADNVVQVVLLAENEELQKTLSTYGLETQSIDQISSSFTVLPPQALVDVYSALGQNSKLELSGRPNRPIGTLATSRLYRIEGHVYVFTPQFMDVDSFYLNSDPDYLVSTIESELTFTNANWFFPGRPTLTVVLTNAMLGDITNKDNATYSNPGLVNALLNADASKKNLLNFFMNLRSGECNGVRIRLSRLTETVNTSNIESLDFLINKPDVDWSNILSANKTYHRKNHQKHKRLGFSESNISSPGGINTPGGAKTPRRRSVFGGKLLGTPLDKLNDDSYFQEITSALEKINSQGTPSFKLKDHEIALDNAGTPKAAASPVPAHSEGQSENEDGNTAHKSAALTINTEDDASNGEMLLSLTLGDLSQFEPAVKSLQNSVNLYDQIDLLQYLASCKNLDEFIVDLDATIRNLLEEVYVKSKRLQYWSVARQASGLLNKTMPSLTYNLTDLVIRQKQVSIGAGATEHLISTPVGPDALNKMIAEQCLDDVREGPVVQEIIISLGNFIRTTPYMFDGILRLRTHFIIIALREEISRINDFNEEEAIEHLMQLSPFELQSLLGTVMSGPGMCEEATIIVRDKPGGYLVLSQEFDPTRRVSADLTTLTLPPSKNNIQVDLNEENKKANDVLVIRAQSGGYNAGNFARVEINGNVLAATTRGLHVWAIDRLEKLVLEHASFDTHISNDESDDLVQFIRSLAPGLIIVMASKDDFTEHLSKEAIDALKSLGSTKIEDVKYRDSYVLIAEKNGNREDTVEAHKAANEGPTDLIEEKFAILKKNDILPSEITSANIGYFCPTSNGRWLRRRKNDGALNRVPRHFFSRTWSVLDKCYGLQIGSHFLPRDPTVFEKTPEEFNFALAVEGFLGILRDPAERQVAVEILSLIYRIQKQNPNAPMIEANINIPEIMDSAISEFWNIWTDKNKEVFEKSPLFENGFDYNTHKEMAHGLFYDLPLDNSSESTTTYLAKSIKKALNFNFDFTL